MRGEAGTLGFWGLCRRGCWSHQTTGDTQQGWCSCGCRCAGGRRAARAAGGDSRPPRLSARLGMGTRKREFCGLAAGLPGIQGIREAGLGRRCLLGQGGVLGGACCPAACPWRRETGRKDGSQWVCSVPELTAALGRHRGQTPKDLMCMLRTGDSRRMAEGSQGGISSGENHGWTDGLVSQVGRSLL